MPGAEDLDALVGGRIIAKNKTYTIPGETLGGGNRFEGLSQVSPAIVARYDEGEVD